MSKTADDRSRFEARKRLRLRLKIAGLVAVPLLVGVVIVRFWIDWQMTRVDPDDVGSAEYVKIYQKFLDDIDADRLDAAYQSTTAAFQSRVSRKEFEDTAHRLAAFKRKPDTKGIEAESTGPAGGDYRGNNRMVFKFTLEDQQGSRRQTSTTVEQQGNILDRRPPPPRIEEFKVSEALTH